MLKKIHPFAGYAGQDRPLPLHPSLVVFTSFPPILLRPSCSTAIPTRGVHSDGDITAIKDAVDFHLRLLADYLIHDNGIPLPWGRVGGKDNADPIVAAVGAIALAYVRNRICAPRDMSAGAATAFRAAADRVLASLY